MKPSCSNYSLGATICTVCGEPTEGVNPHHCLLHLRDGDIAQLGRHRYECSDPCGYVERERSEAVRAALNDPYGYWADRGEEYWRKRALWRKRGLAYFKRKNRNV